MSDGFPTYLSPWFVVQRNSLDKPLEMEFWSADGEDVIGGWTANPHQAMLFMSIQSAARVADAEAAEVRVLYNRDGLREFRPREFS